MPNFLGLYPMAPMTDFAQQTVGVNAIDDETITELMRIVCYDQPIYDDDCVEGDEWLGLTLGVDRSSVLTTVQPMYNQSAILIQDNDSEFHYLQLCCHIALQQKFRMMQLRYVYTDTITVYPDFILCSGCGWSGTDILPCLRGCGCGGAVC